MRLAALYDIHGNLPALEAVLAAVRSAEVDQIVIGGDVVPGPMPRGSIDRLLAVETPIRFIAVNGDREIVSLRRDGRSGGFPEIFRPMMQWVAEQLTPADEAWLAGWPATLTINMPAIGEVLFCHATPRSDSEIFTRATPEAAVATALNGVSAGLVVCGHTHMQFDRVVGGIRVVNAGSVGMPFQEPGAYWLLLDSNRAGDGQHIELQRTVYDLESAAGAVRGTSYPLAATFAADSILRPPAEATMVEAFTAAGLK